VFSLFPEVVSLLWPKDAFLTIITIKTCCWMKAPFLDTHPVHGLGKLETFVFDSIFHSFIGYIL